MKLSLTNNSFFAFCTYFMLVTISNTVVTSQSYEVVKLIRIILVFLLIISGSLSFYKSTKYLSSIIIWSFLFIYYLFITFILGFEPQFNYILDFLIILIGLLVLLNNFTKSQFNEKKLIIFILFYFILTLLFILFTQGFSSYFPPKFNFSYGSMLIDREESYSLGLTSFFGMNSIVFLYAYMSNYKNKNIFLLFSSISFLLCFASGARGEFIITLLLLLFLFIFYRVKFKRFFLTLLAITSFLLFYLFKGGSVLNDFDFDSFTIIQRMQLLFSGDFSSRDQLLIDGLNLLINKPLCLVTGCGIGFFQDYYGYSKSLYPHNFLMEFIISYGILIFIPFMVLAISGFLVYIRRTTKSNLFALLFTYFFMISLKSGYMIGSWFVFSSLLFFINIFIIKLSKYSRNKISVNK